MTGIEALDPPTAPTPAKRDNHRRGRVLSALVVGWIGISTAAAVPREADRDITLDCASPDVEIALTPVSAPVRIVTPPGAILELRERDVDVTLTRDGKPETIDWDVPVRFGVAIVELAADEGLIVSPQVQGNRKSGIELHLHCAPSTGSTSSLLRLSAVAVAAARNNAAGEPDALDAVDAGALAGDRWLAALASHMRAQEFLMESNTSQAAAAFEQAEEAWLEAGDETRALVARVARAEDLQRLGRHDDALALAVSPPQGTRSAYFTVRLQLSTCVARHYRHEIAAAADCYRQTIQQLDELDERAEFVSAVQAYAQMQRLAGKMEEADALCRDAMELVTGPDADRLRGRLLQTRAEIALTQGKIDDGLSYLDQAATAFAVAGAARNEGNALLQLAAIYTQLGALPEAYDAIVHAFARFPPKDAPARVAATLATLAKVEQARGRHEYEARWLAQAEAIYRHLGMPLELDGVHAAQAALALTTGDERRARALLASADPAITYYRSSWDVVRARLQAHDQSTKTRRIDNHVAITVASAARAFANGDTAQATRLLESGIETVVSLVSQTRNAVLRQLLSRQLAPLSREHVRILQSSGRETASTLAMNAQTYWRLAWLRAQLISVKANDAAPPASSFDAAVARELFSAAGGSTDTLALLDVLSRSGTAAAIGMPERPALKELMERLPEDAMLLTHLDGGEQGVVLAITRDRVNAYRAVSERSLAEHADKLRALVSNPAAPVSAIRSAGDDLQHALFGEASPAPVVDQLLIDRDSMLATIPWSIITWRGTTEPIVDRSLIRTVSLAGRMVNSPVRLRDISIFAPDAAGDSSASARHPRLPNVAGEAASVVDIAGHAGVAATLVDIPDRNRLIAALARRGIGIHVATHGYGDRGRIGHSGIWLGDDADLDGAFVSALEPTMRGVDAELVVLNACSLAESESSISSNLSFATAISRAGGAHVVAALWATSDGAADTWVPAFYRSLLGDARGDVAIATRHAQNALRQTRSFRHPFFWASIVSIER